MKRQLIVDPVNGIPEKAIKKVRTEYYDLYGTIVDFVSSRDVKIVRIDLESNPGYTNAFYIYAGLRSCIRRFKFVGVDVILGKDGFVYMIKRGDKDEV